MLMSQIGGEHRAPADFILQGQRADGSWTDLLTVTDAYYLDGGVATWQVDDAGAFSDYRLVITANGGSPHFVTIRRLVLSLD